MSIGRSAQQQVDTAITSLDFIDSVIQLAKNPKAIDEHRKNLLDANTIAEERRKEAEDAERIIAEAKLAGANLEKDKSAHAVAVEAHKTKMAEEHNTLLSSIAELANRKVAFEEEISAKTAEIENLRAQAETRHKAADKRDADHSVENAKYNEDVAVLKDEWARLADAQKKHTEAVTRFSNWKKTVTALPEGD